MPVKHSRQAQRIFHLLLTEESLTRQEIAERLHLSMPTALQNITELLQSGLLEECGAMQSTGGRKAKKVCLNANAGVGIGIDIALHHTELVLTDLKGNVLCKKQLSIVFRDETAWYQQLQDELKLFLQENESPEHIVGAGISFPGIIDAKSEQIIRSHIFSLENVSLDRFQKYIPYPVVVANDANCAAFAEHSLTHDEDYIYLSLNESVGGAIIRDGKLYTGDTCQAGEIGHMLLIPNGKQCYCGKYGCADAYLSPNALTTWGQNTADFFAELQSGSERARAVWQDYIEHLAILVTNLRMLCDTKIVLGGAVGCHMQPYLQQLLETAANYDRFAREIDYVDSCAITESAFAAGAAMLALQQYDVRLFEEDMQ